MAWTERYVRDDAAGGGDGTTNTNSGGTGAWTLAEALAAYASGQRVNVRAGTYANTTTSRTFGTAGTTTAPVWWRGFNTTPGDIDTDNTLAKPSITFTTGVMIVSAAHQMFSALSISGAATSVGQVQITNATTVGVRFHRCRIECTGTNANSSAFGFNNSPNGGLTFSNCWLKATSSANGVLGGSNGAGTNWSVILHSCVIEGGGDGVRMTGTTGTNQLVAVGCIFDSCGSDGVEIAGANSGMHLIDRCTFYNCGGDGVRVSATITGLLAVTNSIFSQNGGYGINNSTGTNTNIIKRMRNLYYSNTSGTENGFGDNSSFSDQTDSASPFVGASSDNFSLVASSNGKANGAPGGFENFSSTTGYLDIGAAQRREHSAAARFILGLGG